jgi:rSAM/selenodomain-associated transferase 2
MPSISVVIPVYRDADALARLLDATELGACEIIVAATDADREALAEIRVRRPDVIWIEGTRGRARQMNAGAAAAHGEWIVFLHADTQLGSGWRRALESAAGDSRVVGGCFRLALDSRAWCARAIEAGVRWRVRLLRLPYGDQAIFVRRTVFDEMGGYTDLPLMEDVEFVGRLRRAGRLFASAVPALTSARRWERDGWLRRSASNVLLLMGYFCGVSPERLGRLYNKKYADQTRVGHPQL